ncbi:GIY-YIG nuclease family protein [Acetobacterium wieringae]|uniref:GIY-YIG nuclease family protein n=1 Tax=Acetobacterium wieringae TaxID=52694 RepID=UPI002033E597|nr:GIY-YIG nuclease family protein [Acetobacterium wieringae]URN85631.1 GIY-YIG nuclease family protein [Acetobacterium wieringae]
MKNWFVYVILCDDGSLYKGHTDNLERRYKEHCSGNGAQHSRWHKPIKMVYYERLDTLEEAVKREKYLKTGVGREWLKKEVNP